MDYAVGAVRIAVGGILLVAGVSKAGDRERFLEALDAFGIVPKMLRVPASFVIPTVEIAIGALLLVGLVYRAAAAAAMVMIAVFTAGVLVSMARGDDSECACFGALSRSPMGPATLLRNAVLLASAALVHFAGPGAPALTTPGGP